MTDMIMNSAWQGLLAGVAWFFHAIGWGGLIVLIGGGLLLVSSTANAMKFLSRPRGMAVSAALLLAGLVFVWWTWPVAEASTSSPPPVASGPASLTQPQGHHARKELVPPKAAEASKLVKMPTVATSLPWAEPIMPFIVAPQPVPKLPPMVPSRVPVPPVIVPKPGHHATPGRHPSGHTVVTQGKQAPVASLRPSTVNSGRAASPDAGVGLAARPQLTPKQQRQQANANYNRLFDAQYQRMYGQMMGGMMRPGGMHPMGGHMGGMGHMGGHHR
jgi:hypothetical protein